MIILEFLKSFVMGKFVMQLIEAVKHVYINTKVNSVSGSIFTLVCSLLGR